MIETRNPIITRFAKMKRELNKMVEFEKLDPLTDYKAQQFLIKYKEIGYYGK